MPNAADSSQSLHPPRARTPAQQAASRRNGARSRGPATAAGKLNSRGNAITHGMTAKAVILKHEADDLFINVLAALEEEHQPATETEHNLVDNMALARWRAMRTWGQEKALLDRAMDEVLRASAEPTLTPEDCGAQALRQLADTSRVLTWIDRNENRCHRLYHRSLRDLQRLREHRARMAEAGPLDPNIENDKTNLSADAKQTPAVAPNPAEHANLTA